MNLRRVWRIARWLLLGTVVLAVALVLAVAWVLTASRAQLSGKAVVPGLTAQVIIERDSLGVPTITASNRLDATFALGFLHAQERFFQMDLARRAGGGTLAELFGEMAAGRDLAQRLHRPASRARAALANSTPAEQELVRAYARGINAGLEALDVEPPEYLGLSTTPAAWNPEDMFLVAFAMFEDLHDIVGGYDHFRGIRDKALGSEAAAFFSLPDVDWGAAIDGSLAGMVPVPTPQQIDFRSPAVAVMAPITSDPKDSDDADVIHGSNNWAVGGRRSASGGAIVANDMHLGLSVPNTWYRARLVYCDSDSGIIDVTGVTLPGTPVIVSGSNGYIAWGNTASHLDIADLILLELDPANTNRYRTPEGWKTFEDQLEVVRVSGSTNRQRIVRETLWGPLVTHGTNTYALACSWHRPGGVDGGMIRLERMRDTASALALANQIGTPLNNLVVGDSSGVVGYTLMGRLPNRSGFDGSVPVSWASGQCRWDGWIPPEKYPRWLKPTNDLVWTANSRVLGTPEYACLPNAGQDNGARAGQIRDALLLADRATERDLWQIYHDDRALFMQRWQKLLMTTLALPEAATNQALQSARERVEAWGGHAGTNSPGYWIVKVFRDQTVRRLFEPVNHRLRAFDPEMRIRSEQAAWAWLQARPRHLLDPKFDRYEELLLACAQSAVEEAPTNAVWGDFNRTAIRHPLSRAVPQLGRWLDMPDAPVSGASYMPKVHSPGFGVSQRMIVSPGRETNGFFNMPGGQSGHFLSPFYRTEMDSWLKVEPQPFLPGETRYRLALVPGAN